MRAILKIMAKAGRKIVETAGQKIVDIVEIKIETEIEIGTEIEIETVIEIEKRASVEAEVDPKKAMETGTVGVTPDLEIRVLEIAETTEVAGMTRAEKVEEEQLHCSGMYLHQDLSMLHLYNTRPCKLLGKYLQL